MKRIFFYALACCLTAILGLSSAWAENYTYAGCQGGNACGAHNDCDCMDGCLDDCGCGRGGYLFDAEMLIWQYNRADGLRVGDEGAGEQVNSDYNVAPRLTLGWIRNDGLGFRGRWFEYTHREAANEGGGSQLNVDTFNLDFEVFERVALNECWDFEMFGGFRYNEFDERMLDGAEVRLNSINALGGIVGAEASRSVRGGRLYGRLREAILNGNKTVINTDFGGGLANPGAARHDLLDSVVGMTEISMGYELTRDLANGSLLVVRAGYEWQLWHNYSSAFTGPLNPAGAGTTGESIWAGPADVGFNGFTFSAGVEY